MSNNLVLTSSPLPSARPYLYMQLARFQQRIAGNAAAARKTFRAGVSDVPGSRELWLAFLEFEAAQTQVCSGMGCRFHDQGMGPGRIDVEVLRRCTGTCHGSPFYQRAT